MENEKVVEQTTVTETEKTEEKLIPQSQVNGLIAKESKIAVEKLLKDLGVTDFESAKDGLSKFKEMQDAQKTNEERLAEEKARLEAELIQTRQEARQIKIDRVLDDILTELEIDKAYSKTILKLTDLSSVEDINKENLKAVIENTINEELPMLVKGEKIKVGATGGSEDKLPAGTNDYLREKYKNNPFFKG